MKQEDEAVVEIDHAEDEGEDYYTSTVSVSVSVFIHEKTLPAYNHPSLYIYIPMYLFIFIFFY